MPSQLRCMEHWWWGRGWPLWALGAARKLGSRSTATGHGMGRWRKWGAEPGTSVPPAGMAAEVSLLVPTIDLGDRGACVNLPDPLDKILRQLLLGWDTPVQRLAVRGSVDGGFQHAKPPPAPCTPYLRNEFQEGDLGGGIGQHQFAPHLCPILQRDTLRLPIPAQQHVAHCLGTCRGQNFTESIPAACGDGQAAPLSQTPRTFSAKMWAPRAVAAWAMAWDRAPIPPAT